MSFIQNRNVTSTLNSTTTPLSSGATYTGTWELSPNADVFVMVKADNTGTLYFDFSPDGTNLDSTFPVSGFKVASGVAEVHRAVKAGRYFRIRFVNDTGAQSYMRLTTYYGTYGLLSVPINQTLSNDTDAIIAHTIDEETDLLSGKYGLDRFSVSKFGRNPDVDGEEDIWNGGGNYKGFPTGSAETVSISSSNVNDTSAGTGARTIRIFGLSSTYALQQEDLTLNGTTPVTSSNTYMRIYRAYIITAGSGQTNIGDITCTHTTTTANKFFVMPAGYGQTQIPLYTIPAGYTGYLRSYSASMGDQTTNSAKVAFWTREYGGAVRIQRPFDISTSTNVDVTLYSGITYPEKTDIVMRVMSVQNTNADISGAFALLLLKN